MITSATRISRRGYRSDGATAHLSIATPCLHPDVATNDTGR